VDSASRTGAESVYGEDERTIDSVQQERTRGAVDGLWIGVWEERQGVEGVAVREMIA